MAPQNYYQTLGVDPAADARQIKEAYRKLALAYHPDRNADDAAAADRMKQINEAYAVLSHAERRSQYDQLLHQYGDDAREHFRRTYSQQDIFRESDIQQIFEEMARAFGLRGFDDIFSDLHGQKGTRFERNAGGIHVKGFFFSGSSKPSAGPPGGRLFGALANTLLKKVTGAHFPQKGGDMRDSISLLPDFARQGGPYAYYHRAKDKKLVVHVPAGVRDGQIIRLSGLGQDGTHGAQPGDLLLTVKVRKPLVQRVKSLLGIESR